MQGTGTAACFSYPRSELTFGFAGGVHDMFAPLVGIVGMPGETLITHL